MKIFIYYNKSDDNADEDVAAVKSATKKEAMAILRKYYTEVTKENIFEINFLDSDKRPTNVMIISDY